MALKRMLTTEMIQLSTPWVTKSHELRTLIESIPEVAPLLGRIQEAHTALLAAVPPVGDEEMSEIVEEAARVDARHDGLVNGIHQVLSGFANIAGNPFEASRILHLRDRLLPDGTSVTQRSYREEAAAGVLLETRLDHKARELLGRLAIPGGTLGDAVADLITSAKTLGELEDRRAAHLQKESSGPSVMEVVLARNHWIQTVTALILNLEMAGIDEARTAPLLTPIREAERIADRRAGATTLVDR